MLKEMYYKWALQNGIYDSAKKILYIVEHSDHLSHDGEVLAYDDYMDILLNDGIPYDNDMIDAVLLWGDGTIEFHLRDEADALNWSEFDADILERVLKDLQKKVYAKNNH